MTNTLLPRRRFVSCAIVTFALTMALASAFGQSATTLKADTFPGSDWVAKASSALANLPPSGGVLDLSGITGNPQQVVPADWNVTQSNVELLFGPTNYTISGSVHITGSNVSVQCKGPGSCTLTIVDNGQKGNRSVWIDGGSHITIKGMTIGESGVNGRTGVYGTVRVGSGAFGAITHDVNLLNNSITSGPSVGIYTSQLDGFNFEGNHVFNTRADGIHVSRGSSNGRIYANHIDNTGDDGVGLISFLTADEKHTYPPDSNIKVTNNDFKNIGKNGRSGSCVSIVGGHDIEATEVTCDSPQQSGLTILGGGTGPGAYHYAYRVKFQGSVRNTGQSPSATAAACAYISNARHVVVTIDCQTTNTVSGDGVRIAGVADDITINLSASNLSGRGIYLVQTSTSDARIRKELWTDLGDTAPERVGISNITIANPQISQPRTEAILIQGEPALHIKGVSISGGKFSAVPTGKQPITVLNADQIIRR